MNDGRLRREKSKMGISGDGGPSAASLQRFGSSQRPSRRARGATVRDPGRGNFWSACDTVCFNNHVCLFLFAFHLHQ